MIQWTKDHDHLHFLLKEELKVMRHLSENMEQEEVCITNKDKISEEGIIKDRAVLITALNVARSARLGAIKKLESPTGTMGNQKLEELLPMNNQNSWEIVAMLNQIIAILDRINFYSSRRQMVTHFHRCPPMVKRKRQTSIATLCSEDCNEI